MSSVLLLTLPEFEIDPGSDAFGMTPHVQRFPNNAFVNAVRRKETTDTCSRRKSFPGWIIRIFVGTPPIKVCAVGRRKAPALCNDRQCVPKGKFHWMLLEKEQGDHL